MIGEVRKLFRKPGAKKTMVSETTLKLIENQGIMGDKSFGSRKRQVLIVEEEILEQHSLSPGDLRENIISANLNLSGLSSGTFLEIGDAILKITGDCAPCSYIDELQDGLRDKIMSNRGVLAIVHSGSEIRVGDSMKIIKSGEE
jgi:MOSC domain-containing protein YiiM